MLAKLPRKYRELPKYACQAAQSCLGSTESLADMLARWPRTSEEPSLSLKECRRSPQAASRVTQEPPRTFQELPRRPQELRRKPREPQRSTQGAPKEHPRSPRRCLPGCLGSTESLLDMVARQLRAAEGAPRAS